MIGYSYSFNFLLFFFLLPSFFFSSSSHGDSSYYSVSIASCVPIAICLFYNGPLTNLNTLLPPLRTCSSSSFSSSFRLLLSTSFPCSIFLLFFPLLYIPLLIADCDDRFSTHWQNPTSLHATNELTFIIASLRSLQT